MANFVLFCKFTFIAYLIFFKLIMSVFAPSKAILEVYRRYILSLRILLAIKVSQWWISTLFVLNKLFNPLRFKVEIESKFASKPRIYNISLMRIVWLSKSNSILLMLYKCNFAHLVIGIELFITSLFVKTVLFKVLW